jgi:hypothetical protein
VYFYAEHAGGGDDQGERNRRIGALEGASGVKHAVVHPATADGTGGLPTPKVPKVSPLISKLSSETTDILCRRVGRAALNHGGTNFGQQAEGRSERWNDK